MIGVQLDDFLKQFILQAALDQFVGPFEILDGGAIGRLRGLGGGVFFERRLRPDEFLEFGKLRQVLRIDFRWVFEKGRLAEVRDPDDCALWRFEEPCLHEVRFRPADTVVVQELSAAWQIFGYVGLCQLKVFRQIGVEGLDFLLLSVSKHLEQGLHEFVVFRHGHLKSPHD